MINNEKTILLIDDEEFLIRSLQTALRILGYKVLSASKGMLALKTLEENTFIDAIILDKTMPEMDGFETLKRVRAMNVHCPVIMVSGYYAAGDKNEFISLGAYACLDKPFTIIQLDKIIQEALVSQV